MSHLCVVLQHATKRCTDGKSVYVVVVDNSDHDVVGSMTFDYIIQARHLNICRDIAKALLLSPETPSRHFDILTCKMQNCVLQPSSTLVKLASKIHYWIPRPLVGLRSNISNYSLRNEELLDNRQ